MRRIEKLVVGVAPRWSINQASRVRARARYWRAARRYGPLVGDFVPDAVEHTLLAANDDAVVMRVTSTTGVRTILKIATSDIAVEQAVAETAALEEFAGWDDLGDWRRLVASRQASGVFDGGTWFTQSVLRGVPLSDVSMPSDLAVRQAVAALVPMHAASAVNHDCDEQVLKELVSDPLDLISHWRPAIADQLDAINAECRQRLAGIELVLARQHGDFSPPNVLWDDTTASVSGIVDWKLAPVLLPPELDYVHLGLSLRMRREREEYGTIVISTLSDTANTEASSCVVLANELGPNDFDLRTAATLAWLQHIAFGLEKARELRTNPIWLVNNIDAVVAALQPEGSG